MKRSSIQQAGLRTTFKRKAFVWNTMNEKRKEAVFFLARKRDRSSFSH